ncbi:Prokaryotic diacylglycerol kinase [Polystyrenella longa]|uniref:Prokaryotic diacylglycerol kinase n=1 Tax=Polystyrenella longa TaxID=2528007 RepID=A0A518CT56_9PLAN|nr:diacylglycerol kinase [Polystyrenella longa]QDU82412.1 Prokaryotic diacylglycerol kinase [Polystyrenella longa]
MQTRLNSILKEERPVKQRASWRQYLIELERGFAQIIRSDSVFFFHTFCLTIVLTCSFILGLSMMEWAMVVLSCTLAISAEMFNKVLKAIWDNLGHHFSEAAQNSIRIGTASATLTLIGASITVGIILGHRLWELLH